MLRTLLRPAVRFCFALRQSLLERYRLWRASRRLKINSRQLQVAQDVDRDVRRVFELVTTQQLPPPTFDDFRLVHRAYRAAFGRNPNLLRPRRFTEKMQWRKLFDLNPLYAVLSDKIAVRNFVASRVGDEWLPPLLWIGDTVTEIPFDSIKAPYILKCNHGSGLNVVVADSATIDREKAQEVLRSGLAASFGSASREPGYVPIKPRLLAEQLMLERDGTPPLEHKIFVFDGRAQVIWSIVVDQDRARFDAVYSRDWRPLHWSALNRPYKGILARPQQLEKFIELAEQLGAGPITCGSFLRVERAAQGRRVDPL